VTLRGLYCFYFHLAENLSLWRIRGVVVTYLHENIQGVEAEKTELEKRDIP
jgi:hypothetical protein